MLTDNANSKGRGDSAQGQSYPDDFNDWPEDRKNAFFAREAQEYREKRPKKHAGPSEAAWKPSLTCLSDLRSEPISWLWPGWLARGKMHIIAGQPGVGKSTLAMKMAAVVSSGGRWPDGSVARQGNVVIWSGEDDLSDTLVPRLLASGANRNCVFFVSGMNNGREARPFDPAKDVPALQAAIEEAGGAALIIIDPIVSATAADSHKNSETRRGLQPIVDMAASLNAALIGITHFTKGSEGRSPIDRVTGSLAFGALARVVMVATRGQEGTGPRVLMRAKSNVGNDEGGFNYELQSLPMFACPDIIASVVVWGAAVDGTARSVLAGAEADPGQGNNGGSAAALTEAREWLLDFLQDGPKAAKEIQSACRVDGHSWPTVRRAKDHLGVSSKKVGDSWAWMLPPGAMPSAAKALKHPSHEPVEHLEHLEHLEEGKERNQHLSKDAQPPVPLSTLDALSTLTPPLAPSNCVPLRGKTRHRKPRGRGNVPPGTCPASPSPAFERVDPSSTSDSFNTLSTLAPFQGGSHVEGWECEI